MSSLPRILIVEDELPMRTALTDCLEAEGYRALTASSGREGLERAQEQKPDLILLDIMMPGLDGFSVCAKLRELNNRAPILMITARGTVHDRVTGLDAGADDYLVKPFSTEELLARVRALLRRFQRAHATPETIRLGPLVVDFSKQTARRGGRVIPMSAREFAILLLLVETPGEPVTRERFLDVVWGYTAFPTTRTVDNHIAALRAKLEPDPAHPRWITTVHGVGYKLNATAEQLQKRDNFKPRNV